MSMRTAKLQFPTNSATTQGSRDSRARSCKSREEALQQGIYRTLSEAWEPWSAEQLVIADHDQHFCCLHLCLHNIAYMQPAYLWKSISLQSAFLSSMDPSIYVPTYVPTYPSIHLIYLHLSLSLSLSLSLCIACMHAMQGNATHW